MHLDTTVCLSCCHCLICLLCLLYKVNNIRVSNFTIIISRQDISDTDSCSDISENITRLVPYGRSLFKRLYRSGLIAAFLTILPVVGKSSKKDKTVEIHSIDSFESL